MRRSPRVLLAWIAAAVVMLLTVRVVAGDLGSLHRRARTLGADVSVVLAARDLPLGATVAPNDLRTVRRPSTTVSADAVHDPAAAIGRLVAVAMLRDDVVGTRHLVGRREGVVAEGFRAVHVVVADGFQPPVGAVVDVLVTYDPTLVTGTGSPGQATVVARGARVVFPAGTAPNAGAAASGDQVDALASGVTLLVTEAEARSVAFGASVGQVSLALAPVGAACCAAPAP